MLLNEQVSLFAFDSSCMPQLFLENVWPDFFPISMHNFSDFKQCISVDPIYKNGIVSLNVHS